MTICFPYSLPYSRLAPSLALLLGLTGSLGGCVDPKSIGLETDDEGSGSADADSGSASEGSGGTGGGQTTNASEPTTAGTGDTGNGGCPPIDIGPCEDCTCGADGEWICETVCSPSCEGLACGESCLYCPDGDPDCESPTADGVCTADQQCVGTPPPKLGFCEGALQPGFEAELEAASGCADVVVFAHDAADERGLVLHVDQGLVGEVVATGMPVHVELSATDPTVVLEGRAGFYVTAAECNDAIVSDPDIKEDWLPTAGTVILDLEPAEDGDFALATVQLVDVALHRVQPGPAAITVNVTWSDVLVGWLPG